MLSEHLERQAEEREKLKDYWQESGYLFTSEIGTPLEPGNVNRHLRSVLKQLKIENITPHSLRHSCATFLLASGENPRMVSEILRHADPSLTMRVYAHVLEEGQRRAVSGLDGVFDT